MSIITKSGQVAIAKAVAAGALHLAWGAGDGSWGVPPDGSGLATGLQNEIGRRLITSKGYATAGTGITVSGGTYAVSATPTNALHLTVVFDYADASTSVIRELGIFCGATTNPALPSGQRYFTPDQVTSVGTLLLLQNVSPIFRNITNREQFQFVIEF